MLGRARPASNRDGVGASRGAATSSATAVARATIDVALQLPVPTGATTGNVVVTVSGVASNGVAMTIVNPYRPVGSLLDVNNSLAANLAGLFIMNEGSGTSDKNLVDSQLSNFSGGSQPTWNTSDPSIVFNGGSSLNSYADAGTDLTFDQLTTSKMTVVAKVYVNSVAAAGVCEKNDNNAIDSGFVFGWDSSGALKLTVEKSSTDMRVAAGGGTISPGGWTQVAFTWDGTVATAAAAHLFINGVEQTKATSSDGSGTLGYANATNKPFRIGNAAFDFAGSLNGKMVYLAVYKGRILSTTEMGQLDANLPITAPGSGPNITSLSPTSSAVGASVTITGTNFGSTQGTSTVSFNGTLATATSWSATSIVASVPSGASTGNVVVYASGVNSNGVSFTVVPAPNISNLSPTSGAVAASVTITGTNFGSTQGTSTVSFNGTLATATNWSATSIVAPVPSGATTGNVVVYASGENSNGVSFTVVPPYAYERAIVINSAQIQNTDQQNYPLLISGTYPDLANVANGGEVQSAKGYDVIFTSDAAGANLLPFEQESYSPTTGAVNYWVQVPLVSHTTNTVIYMFYGSQSITSDQSNKTAVWDANYVGVWHLSDGTNLTANDSTSNGNNGVVSGATATSGQIGGGANFDGYAAITVSPKTSLSGSFTIEEWAKPNSMANGLGLFGSRVPIQYEDYAFDATLNVGGVHGDIGNGGLWLTTSADVSFPYSTNAWHHFVYAVTANAYQVYGDGQQIGSGTFIGTPLLFDSNHNLQIGATGYPDEGFSGAVDEVRVSKVVRSADWVATEYNNQSSPGTFAVLCPGQPAGTTLSTCQPPPPTLTFPQVVQVQPSNASGSVPLNTRVVVRFAHPARPGAIVNGTLTVSQGTTAVAGSLALSADGSSLTFTPTQNLTASTSYSVAVTDVSENQTSPEFQSTFTTGSSLDTTAPQIVQTSPQSWSTGVPINASVVVQFSKSIDPGTVTPQSFHVSANGLILCGAVQVDPSGLTASFVPQPPFPVNWTVSVSLSSTIKDTSGNSLSGQTFSFTTSFSEDTDAPTLVGMCPQNGATAVPTNGLVVLEFNEPLDPLSVSQGVQLQSAGVAIPGGIALSDGNQRITYTPETALAPNTSYTVSINAAITDMGGFALQNPGTFTFTTSASTDTTTPQVVSSSPANNASGVPTNVTIQIQFSKPVDPLTVTVTTFTVNADPSNFTIPASGTVSVSADGFTATFAPSVPLDSGTYYFVQATNGITDIEGHALTSFESLLLTGTAQQTAPTTVVAVSPGNGASGVPVNAEIEVLLSGPISVASVGSNAVVLSVGGNTISGIVSLSSDRTKLAFVPTSDLIPSFGTKLSMIFANERGRVYVEEQAHGSADDWGTEAGGGGAKGGRRGARGGRVQAHALRLEGKVRWHGCEPGAGSEAVA